MTRQRSEKLLFVGYENDLAPVLPQFHSRPTKILLLTDEAADRDIPDAVDRIVFAMSLNACYSTRMRSLAQCVIDRVSAREKYVLLVGEFDADRFVFPEIRDLPRLSIEDLRARLGASGHSNL